MSSFFITGRFCSGTTFLWNFFHWMNDCCAYYEPLHPSLLSSSRYISPKRNHHGVDDYWQAYRELPDLDLYYSPTFGFERLALQSDESHLALKNYIYYLIHNNQQKKQVALKFNRIDFRLGWIKQNFPEAKIIHIKRNVRDSWRSSRSHLSPEVAKDMFQFNAYELIQWAMVLDEYFPFIIDTSTSSYHLHYFLAKLSEKFSEYYAHLTLDFDHDIIDDFNIFIEKMSVITQLSTNQIAAYSQKRIIPEKKNYSSEEITWLETVETECDSVLNQLKIKGMTPEALLQKNFSPLFPEKRKEFSRHLLAYTYQLENTQISLQGQLDIELQKTLSSRIKEKIKEKLSGK